MKKAYKKALDKKFFKRFVSDIYYFYRFTSHRKDYELCFEPCLNGFEIALYERFGESGNYNLVFPKICLNEEGYEKDVFGLVERTDRTWKHALQAAEELLTKL